MGEACACPCHTGRPACRQPRQKKNAVSGDGPLDAGSGGKKAGSPPVSSPPGSASVDMAAIRRSVDLRQRAYTAYAERVGGNASLAMCLVYEEEITRLETLVVDLLTITNHSVWRGGCEGCAIVRRAREALGYAYVEDTGEWIPNNEIPS